MGRTLPTFNMYLNQEVDQWQPFRRALRREDRAAFDRLMGFAKQHMAEAACVARPVPFDTLVMAVLLEQQKAIEQLQARLEALTNPAADNRPASLAAVPGEAGHATR